MKSILASLFILFSTVCQGQKNANLIKDIYPGINSSIYMDFTMYNNVIYFGADDGIHGIELWRSDGTTEGTYMVKDINPGSAGSITDYLFTVYKNRLYFVAQLPNHRELWTSDGTEAGTMMVKSFDNVSGQLYKSNSNLFFVADYGLYTSDGTENGTIKLMSLGTNPLNILGFKNKIYFDYEGQEGRELWESDGTIEGTKLFIDIEPNDGLKIGSSNPYLVGAGDTIFYFVATESIHGRELWRSNGTILGTYMTKDLVPGTSYAVATPGYATFILNNNLYFGSYLESAYGNELIFSNGTSDGTYMVKDINPGSESSIDHPYFKYFNGYVYFTATTSLNGQELWKTDGTNEGTSMVADIEVGPSSSGAMTMVASSEVLYFSAYDKTYGNELWSTDGTLENTKRLTDLNLKNENSIFASGRCQSAIIKDTLIYLAKDGVHGYELFKYKPATISTAITKNLDFNSLLNAYPNPFDNSITLEIKGQIINEVSVYDILGTKCLPVLTKVSNESLNIDLAEYKSKVFFITILLEDGTVLNTSLIKKE